MTDPERVEAIGIARRLIAQRKAVAAASIDPESRLLPDVQRVLAKVAALRAYAAWQREGS